MDIGLLLLRLTVGLTLAAHGTQKLFGWFGGPGLDATGQFFAMLGFPLGRRHALMAGLAETRVVSFSSARVAHAGCGGTRL
jgi:putative oxidoreductase